MEERGTAVDECGGETERRWIDEGCEVDVARCREMEECEGVALRCVAETVLPDALLRGRAARGKVLLPQVSPARPVLSGEGVGHLTRRRENDRGSVMLLDPVSLYWRSERERRPQMCLGGLPLSASSLTSWVWV